MKKFILLLLIALCSDGVLFAQKHHIVNQSQARMITTNMGAITAPIIAELGEISPQKITYTRRFNISFYQNVQQIINDLSEYKQATIAKYCNENNYDLIVNAIFQITTENDELVVTLMGFPAKYSKFRPATQADSWMLNYIGGETTNSRQIINNQ